MDRWMENGNGDGKGMNDASRFFLSFFRSFLDQRFGKGITGSSSRSSVFMVSERVTNVLGGEGDVMNKKPLEK